MIDWLHMLLYLCCSYYDALIRAASPRRATYGLLEHWVRALLWPLTFTFFLYLRVRMKWLIRQAHQQAALHKEKAE